MKKLTIAEVKAMSVAEMRKVANKQFGIKNPSQYRRVQLEQMVVDLITAQAREEEKKAKATKQTTKKTKSVQTTKKAMTVSDDQVQAIADVLTQSVIKREVEAKDLMAENRKVLIRVMKALHCKRWYRTYDKKTMVELILGATM